MLAQLFFSLSKQPQALPPLEKSVFYIFFRSNNVLVFQAFTCDQQRFFSSFHSLRGRKGYIVRTEYTWYALVVCGYARCMVNSRPVTGFIITPPKLKHPKSSFFSSGLQYSLKLAYPYAPIAGTHPSLLAQVVCTAPSCLNVRLCRQDHRHTLGFSSMRVPNCTFVFTLTPLKANDLHDKC